MRARLHLWARRGQEIPLDYHYQLSSWVYRTIRAGDESIATWLHYTRDIKPFTFSELYLRGKVSATKLKIEYEQGAMIFSSHRRDVMEAFVEGVLKNPHLEIDGVKIDVSQVEIIREPEFKNEMVFRTLSPIVVSVSRSEARMNKKRFLYPSQKDWYINLAKNMKKRYEKFLGKEYSGRIEIDVLKHHKSKRYNIKGTYVRASKLTFRVRGDPELIKINYQSGFGERTAQGFGCVATESDLGKRIYIE